MTVLNITSLKFPKMGKFFKIYIILFILIPLKNKVIEIIITIFWKSSLLDIEYAAILNRVIIVIITFWISKVDVRL